MSKSNSIYYIANRSDEDIDFGYIDLLKDVDIDTLTGMGVTFNCVYPLTDGFLHYSDTITDREVIFERSLSSLLINWLNLYYDEFEEDELDEFDEDEDFSFEDLISNFIIIRFNKKTKKYSIVKESVIDNCLFQIYENEIEANIMDSLLLLDEVNNLNSAFDDFVEKIESLVEKQSCHIFISTNGGVCDFIITKRDSYMHKNLLKHNILPDKEIDSKRDFIYEYGFENFRAYFNYYLAKENRLAVSLSVYLFNEDEKPDRRLFKKYGFFAEVFGEELKIDQLSASEILECYTTNALTGEKIEPDKNALYCGVEKDDIILGFDLV